MTERKSDFTLPTNMLDDLFSTQEERDDAKLSKIRDIPLIEIDDFPEHPFKVRDDEDMIQLVESVKKRGVITPATVRQKEDGRYELVSGHRRKRACDEVMRGNLKIVKTSSDGKVKGFAFRITGANGYEIILETDENGEIFIEGLRIGDLPYLR